MFKLIASLSHVVFKKGKENQKLSFLEEVNVELMFMVLSSRQKQLPYVKAAN